MENENNIQKKKNEKKIILGIVLAVVIVLLVAFAFFMLKRPLDTDLISSPNEVDPLLEDNRAALESAMRAGDGSVSPIGDSDYVLGSMDAPVQVIVYDDFDSEFSAEYYNTIRQLKADYEDKIVVALRLFPMRSNQYAVEAALAAECAGEQDKFWEMADKMHEAKSEENLNAENILIDAEMIGVDMERFLDCLDTGKYLEKIGLSVTEAENADVNGVPMTFINKRPFPGAHQLEDFIDSAEQEREGLRSIIEKL